ncbi:MAG: uracil phosphoribosyltransferase [Treponema sp.]|nr:uracil phosphoribosyltransferase [Treponema sp.]
MNKIVLKAEDLDGFLTGKDKTNLAYMDSSYRKALACFNILSTTRSGSEKKREEKNLIGLFNEMGSLMQELCKDEKGIRVYSFLTPQEDHPEASRVIAKLRDYRTENEEFVYYIQRAYEMLFKLAYGGTPASNKNYLLVQTPVSVPVQNFAIHKINNIDKKIDNTVMCVMLRGALLPSMIFSKEIEEYSSSGYVTPFALFKIARDDSKHENNMEYILDLDKSYFNLDSLNDRDLIFADPMNATGGSLVTVVKYLLAEGIKPHSVSFVNVIAALKGALRVVRALEHCTVYTLWMDPMLNELAYILPGLGDAGDRINGRDLPDQPRNIIQLVADYGANIARLYRKQLRKIEDTVLGKKNDR